MDNNNVKNIQEPRLHGQANFPQPIIVGFGSVTSSGAKNDAEVFHPQSWIVTKPSTGLYRITHNIGHLRYNVNLTVVSTGPYRFINLAAKGVNSFDVYTGSLSGLVASDQPFEFTVYLNM